MTRTTLAFAASLIFIASAQTADKPKDTTAALEKKLHGVWYGPACGGDWTFGADGSLEVKNYTPGGNKFTGTWEVRWDSLPPTLAWACKTSDAPDRIKIGKTSEVKLIQLNDESFAYQYPDNYPTGHIVHFERKKK